MGRASIAEAKKTKQKIIDAAFHITMKEGFERLTFTSLSNHCGISRSGINRHFPKKSDLIISLEPLLSNIMLSQMNFESTSKFYVSWVDGLKNNADFRAAILASGPIIPTNKGINNLKKLIPGEEKEVLGCIYICIGYAMVNLSAPKIE